MTELDSIYASLRENVEVKDRKFRFQKYEKTFLGTEAIDYLVSSGTASTREDAIELCRALEACGMFTHVTNDHEFKDENLYYRFAEDSNIGFRPKDTQTGKLTSWSKFLQPNVTLDLQTALPEPERYSLQSATESAPTQVDVGVSPLDKWNAQLLDNVHPHEWVNPKPLPRYNLVVIGAGAGGLVSTASIAGLGGSVAIVEKHLLGGDCLNVGCVPSKALLRSAHAVKAAKSSNALGLRNTNSLEVDFSAVMSRLRRLRAAISPADSAERFSKKLGAHVFLGTAKFTSPQTVEVGGQTLRFSRAIIATGGRPNIPPVPGLSQVPYLTNMSLFNLTKLPKRFGVIGAGPVGLEMAQAFSILGSKVQVFFRGTEVLPKEDYEAARLVEKSLEEDGVVFRRNLNYKKFEVVEQEGGRVIRLHYAHKKTPGDVLVEEFDEILVATGRTPNVENLGLEQAKVNYIVGKGIQVNDNLRTSNKKIYAVGDCCTRFQFTHVADFMARMAIRNSFFFGNGKMSNMLIPWSTFTDPEVAHVGLYERDLDTRGVAFDTYQKEFADVDRAILEEGEEAVGFVKIHTKKGSDKILGATIVGRNAGNMISEISVAMQNNIGLGLIGAVIHPYPTEAEAIRQCGDLYNKTRLTPAVKQLLRRLIKLK